MEKQAMPQGGIYSYLFYGCHIFLELQFKEIAVNVCATWG